MSTPSGSDIGTSRLFRGSCVALVSTSVAFAVVGIIMPALKVEFGLSNSEVGWIGGAALWGFAVSQLLFAPLCDTLGMRVLVRMAFVGHVAGAVVMIMAPGFGLLFAGALLMSIANGLVEAACNPLVAALYPKDKTVRLNQFHVWFPGGIVLGSLAAYALEEVVAIDAWQVKVALIMIPTAVYGVMLLGQRFPVTEGVRSGVSMGEMFRACLGTPLMLLMLIAMTMTASVELGPGRWLPAVLEAGRMPGVLVLAYVGTIMAVLRYWAGPVVRGLSATGILLASAITSGLGLLWMSAGGSVVSVFLSVAVFAVGVCYFWPTMLGFVSERIPRSGALGLGLMGTVGMAFTGLVTTPWMGDVVDKRAHEILVQEEQTYSILAAAAGGLELELMEEMSGPGRDELVAASDAVAGVLRAYYRDLELPVVQTAGALRTLAESGSRSPTVGEARQLLGAAEFAGGLTSFRRLVPLAGALTLIFLVLHIHRRRSGEGPSTTRSG